MARILILNSSRSDKRQKRGQNMLSVKNNKQFGERKNRRDKKTDSYHIGGKHSRYQNKQIDDSSYMSNQVQQPETTRDDIREGIFYKRHDFHDFLLYWIESINEYTLPNTRKFSNLALIESLSEASVDEKWHYREGSSRGSNLIFCDLVLEGFPAAAFFGVGLGASPSHARSAAAKAIIDKCRRIGIITDKLYKNIQSEGRLVHSRRFYGYKSATHCMALIRKGMAENSWPFDILLAREQPVDVLNKLRNIFTKAQQEAYSGRSLSTPFLDGNIDQSPEHSRLEKALGSRKDNDDASMCTLEWNSEEVLSSDDNRNMLRVSSTSKTFRRRNRVSPDRSSCSPRADCSLVSSTRCQWLKRERAEQMVEPLEMNSLLHSSSKPSCSSSTNIPTAVLSSQAAPVRSKAYAVIGLPGSAVKRDMKAISLKKNSIMSQSHEHVVFNSAVNEHLDFTKNSMSLYSTAQPIKNFHGHIINEKVFNNRSQSSRDQYDELARNSNRILHSSSPPNQLLNNYSYYNERAYSPIMTYGLGQNTSNFSLPENNFEEAEITNLVKENEFLVQKLQYTRDVSTYEALMGHETYQLFLSLNDNLFNADVHYKRNVLLQLRALLVKTLEQVGRNR